MKYWTWYWVFCTGFGVAVGIDIRGYFVQAFIIALLVGFPLCQSWRDAIRHES